jgi:hypothetical protein
VYDRRRIGTRWLSALKNIAAAAGLLLLMSENAHADCAPPEDGPPLCLAGTILSRNYSAALIEPAGKQEVDSLRTGAALSDWRVLEITARSVLLGQEERRVRLSLDDHKGAQTDPEAAETVPSPFAQSESIAARSAGLRAERQQARRLRRPLTTR